MNEDTGFGRNSGNRKTRIALVILFTCFFLTYLAVHSTIISNANHEAVEYNLIGNEIKTKISTRLNAHALLLNGAASLFATKDTVTRKDWNIYIENCQLDKNLPGIQGVGFSVIVPKNQLKEHIRLIRREGFPEYNITPAGTRDYYTSIIFLEPFSGRNLNAFGYDMFSESVRRKAMEKARDHNIAVLSGKVLLVQEATMDVQAGTLMYVPVYRHDTPVNTVEDRRSAIKGWVYSPYRMNDLMHGILGRWDLMDVQRMHLQIYDNDVISNATLLFDSQKNDTVKHNDLFKRTLILPVEFNGTKWTLVFSQSKEQYAMQTYLTSNVILILICGIVISLLLYFLVVANFNTKQRAQKIAEHLIVKLRESEEQRIMLSQAVEQSLISVVITDLDGNIEYGNPYVMSLTGYSPKELLGKNPRIFSSGEKSAEEYKYLWDTVLSGGVWQGEFHNKKKSGELYWEAAVISGIKNQNGEISHLLAVKENITERKIAEWELKSKNEELRRVIAEKDRFFSIIAHDLRSPFSGFLGITGLMAEEMQNLTMEEMQQMAISMKKSADNLFRLLENLLQWAGMQQGLIPFQPKLVRLLPIANESLSLVSEVAKNKWIKILSQISDETEVWADAKMLQTVIRNLLSNAVKFTYKGGQITLSAQTTGDLGVVISIKDSGIGMSPEMVDNLFLLDSKSNRKGTEGEPSSGLGLLLCKEFVEKHGGKLWVESEVGMGSTFSFNIPNKQ
ncbi:MAG: CHASE domain-containing protein [Prolixibacteraceae bacterium]|jgi:PAS domain S-box-containing protein|nr:CHASE domain-containing protein [Prolixibacteraceae bacterium]